MQFRGGNELGRRRGNVSRASSHPGFFAWCDGTIGICPGAFPARIELRWRNSFFVRMQGYFLPPFLRAACAAIVRMAFCDVVGVNLGFLLLCACLNFELWWKFSFYVPLSGVPRWYVKPLAFGCGCREVRVALWNRMHCSRRVSVRFRASLRFWEVARCREGFRSL